MTRHGNDGMAVPELAAAGDAGQPPGARYGWRRVSYAATFPNPWQGRAIRWIEALTGKLTLLRLIRAFEARGVPSGQAFFDQALDVMRIPLETPPEQIARIPPDGPLVITANHPHGLVDGMVLAALIGRVRQDYRVLTRALLTNVREVERFLIPVPFAHDPDARAQNLEMRKAAMQHLKGGGAVVLFPSGVVASADRMFGPAVEREWNPFTARLIQRSGARVLPVHFPGQNSRAYQIAARLSATVRQGLLIHEVVHAVGKPQAPVIGTPIEPDELATWQGDTRGLMGWLRDRTLALGNG